MTEDRFAAARDEARRVLEEHGVTRPEDIDLTAIAAAEGAEVSYDDLEGATARVMRIGSKARIRISNRNPDPGGRHFTLGHEIGHLRLKHEIPKGDARELAERVCAPLGTDRRLTERAASVFATELVMPQSMVMPFCSAREITLLEAKQIAQTFSTSVLASALRIVELTDQKCAVAYSVAGRVKWLKASVRFPVWIPKGRRVDPLSHAHDYFHTGTLDDSPAEVPAETWLRGERADGIATTIVEHSCALPGLGAVFTMLWVPEERSRHGRMDPP